MTLPPPASGVRMPWRSAPTHIREAVEGWLGSPISGAEDMPGGFSPGVAAKLRTIDGRSVFCKAAGPEPNPTTPRMHFRETRIAAELPEDAPAPRFLWSRYDEETGWVILLFESIDGYHPVIPWKSDELDRVLRAIAGLGESLTPSPVRLDIAGDVADWGILTNDWWGELGVSPPAGLDDWSRRHAERLAELVLDAPLMARGSTLLHLDLRADNILLTPDKVYVVDWPHARIGAPWLESICFAPSVTMQGGPPPEEILLRHPAAISADPRAIDSALAAVAGFFTNQSLQPAPPGLPTLRPFQAAQGVIARDWLARRTGLE